MNDQVKKQLLGQLRTVAAAAGGAVLGSAATKAGVDPTQVIDAATFIFTNAQPAVAAVTVLVAAIGSFLNKRNQAKELKSVEVK